MKKAFKIILYLFAYFAIWYTLIDLYFKFDKKVILENIYQDNSQVQVVDKTKENRVLPNIEVEVLWVDDLWEDNKNIDKIEVEEDIVKENIEVEKEEFPEVVDYWELDKKYNIEEKEIEENVKKELTGLCRTEKEDQNILNEIKKFPKAIDLEYNLYLWIWTCPVQDNNSKIYFDFNNNNLSGNTQNWDFTITWLIINDVEKIEVIWDGDMVSYFLNKYIPWEKQFVYNISTKWENIVEWENKYLIRGYSKNWVYEEVFNLYYNWDN